MRQKGVTLIELMVVLVIFGVVMAGLYSAYTVQLREGGRQYALAQSEMEFQIAKSVLERDLAMTGFGIMDKDQNYIDMGFAVPRMVKATDGTPDTLTLIGTALGKETRSSQLWSVYTATAYTGSTSDFMQWTDTPDENLKAGDKIVYMEPNDKVLRYLSSPKFNTETGKAWLFPYPGGSDLSKNPHPDLVEPMLIVYGMQTAPSGTGYAVYPYYTVKYYLGGTNPAMCADGTKSLLRAESKKDSDPSGGEPLFNCVLDFQVAFGLDTDEKNGIDCWDNGGVTTGGYPNPDNEDIRKKLKQMRAYILVQEGKKDPAYTHSPSTIRVGDAALTACDGSGVGRNVTLDTSKEQQHYRWKVLEVSVMPRNIRF